MSFILLETTEKLPIGGTVTDEGIQYRVMEVLSDDGKQRRYNIRPTNQIVSKLFCYGVDTYKQKVVEIFNEANKEYSDNQIEEKDGAIKKDLMKLLLEAEANKRVPDIDLLMHL